MGEYPLVDVIIPVYNRKEMTCETIDSILNQTYPNLRVLVCDDCSSDGAYGYLKSKYENTGYQIEVVQNETNYGLGKNWSESVKRVTGEYVFLINSDDLVPYDYVEKIMRVLRKHPECAFAYTPIKVFHDLNDREIVLGTEKIPKRSSYKVGPLEIHLNRNRYLMKKSGVYEGERFIKGTFDYTEDLPVSPSNAIFKREYLNVVYQIPNKQNFDHGRTGAGADIRLFLNALVNSPKYCYVKGTVAYFRAHSGSTTCSDDTIFHGYLSSKLDFLNTYYFSRKDLYEDLMAEMLFMNKRNLKIKKQEAETILLQYMDNVDLSDIQYERLLNVAKTIKMRQKKLIMNKFLGRVFWNGRDAG